MLAKFLSYIPHGNTLDEQAWQRRHRLLLWVLFVHVPGLFLFGLSLGRGVRSTALAVVVPAVCVVGGRLLAGRRRLASFLVTVGLTYCSAALVGLSGGSIEAHFHFFIIIGFIALYQDWVPFLWNIAFTVASHGIGSILRTNLIFNHPAAQGNPWVWSAIHGLAVLAACGGVVVFWKTTEEEQKKSLGLTERLADEEIRRRRFTADLLVSLARRNQGLLYRQLEVINQLEDHETNPDALAELFKLDHLATRIRRNAESLLVLSGEKPPRTWSRPVPLVDVVRAAIAETEDLDRVAASVADGFAVSGSAVADLTHLLAELIENAVRFSPPTSGVTVSTRPAPEAVGGCVLTVEDWGVGMPAGDLAHANDLLATPREVDLSVAQRLGLHVVARLSRRHGIQVSLVATPGGGITAVVVLPPSLFITTGDGIAGPPRHAVATVAPAAVAPAAVAPAAAAAVATAPAPAPPPTPPPRLSPAPMPSRDPAPKPEIPRRLPRRPAASSVPPPLAPVGLRHPRLPSGPDPAAPAPAARQRPEPAEPEEQTDFWALAAPRTPPTPPQVPQALERRVPQAHLAPQLRLDPQGVNGPPSSSVPFAQIPAPDAARAREVLSRYQASRKAARAAIERGELGDAEPAPDGDEAIRDGAEPPSPERFPDRFPDRFSDRPSGRSPERWPPP